MAQRQSLVLPNPVSNLLLVALRWQVMSPSAEDKLLSLLTEIHSDLRQIKSDLQSLLTLLKQQQQKTTPVSFSNSDDAANPIESAQLGSPEDVLRYLREKRGEDDTGD
jgi:hypothetical protein